MSGGPVTGGRVDGEPVTGEVPHIWASIKLAQSFFKISTETYLQLVFLSILSCYLPIYPFHLPI